MNLRFFLIFLLLLNDNISALIQRPERSVVLNLRWQKEVNKLLDDAGLTDYWNPASLKVRAVAFYGRNREKIYDYEPIIRMKYKDYLYHKYFGYKQKNKQFRNIYRFFIPLLLTISVWSGTIIEREPTDFFYHPSPRMATTLGMIEGLTLGIIITPLFYVVTLFQQYRSHTNPLTTNWLGFPVLNQDKTVNIQLTKIFPELMDLSISDRQPIFFDSTNNRLDVVCNRINAIHETSPRFDVMT